MPKKKTNALSAAWCKSVQTPGTFGDGNHLYLKVDDGGAKRWVFRGRLNGKPIARGLGGYPQVTLAEAREKAGEAGLMVQNGTDPAEVRQKARAAAEARAAVPTFEQVAGRVWELNRPAWSGQHALEWMKSLHNHVHPTLGKMLVSDISSRDVRKTLELIWHSKPETARRVKQRVRTVFDYVVSEGVRDDNPVASLRAVLPRQRGQKRHFAAIAYSQISDVLNSIGESGSPITRLTIEFLILTACRSNEVRNAEWQEVDWTTQTWEIPAHKMKMGRPHRVPLARQALAVLDQAWEISGGETGLIFPGVRDSTRPMTPHSLIRILRRNGVEETIHGFRSSFRDWAAENTDASFAAMELALAHGVGSAVVQSYARSDLLEQRRVLMQAWADFVLSG